jgi:hypothetical protein
VDDLILELEIEKIAWEVREEFYQEEVEEAFRELCEVLSSLLRETYIP